MVKRNCLIEFVKKGIISLEDITPPTRELGVLTTMRQECVHNEFEHRTMESYIRQYGTHPETNDNLSPNTIGDECQKPLDGYFVRTSDSGCRNFRTIEVIAPINHYVR